METDMKTHEEALAELRRDYYAGIAKCAQYLADGLYAEAQEEANKVAPIKTRMIEAGYYICSPSIENIIGVADDEFGGHGD